MLVGSDAADNGRMQVCSAIGAVTLQQRVLWGCYAASAGAFGLLQRENRDRYVAFNLSSGLQTKSTANFLPSQQQT